MSNEEEEQITKIKESAIVSLDDDVRKSAIDALSAYKEKGIGAITEIVDASYNNEVRTFGFTTIKKVKQHT